MIHFIKEIKLKVKTLRKHCITEKIVITKIVSKAFNTDIRSSKLETIRSICYLLSKRQMRISLGSNVNTEIIAINITIPVKIPKYIVGIKFDITKSKSQILW